MRKVFILLLSFGLCISCLKIDCEKNADSARNLECLLILENKPSNSNYLKVEGRDINSSIRKIFIDKDRYWALFRDYMSVGDTLIKRKGELVFYIHKKDTILSFPWKCEGKIYE
jgi:hypothetical protein